MQLTSQNTHFPKQWAYSPGTDYETFMAKAKDQQFEIHDDLLYACITYGDGLEQPSVKGFTVSKGGHGYPLLAFFASRALDLYRLPFCPDRTYEWPPSISDRAGHELQAALSELSPSRVESICAELKSLYEHTQRMLRDAGMASVRLKRNITDVTGGSTRQKAGYAELLFKLKEACVILGRESLRFEMDILNSYGDDGGYSHHPVALRHEIPAEDILYCSNFIRSRENNLYGQSLDAVEDGEWVVINRATTGVVELPTTAIELNTKDWQDRWERRSRDPKDAQRFLDAWCPVVLRGNHSIGQNGRFHDGGLVLRPLARLYAAYEILRSGRSSFFVF